jgi:hypothetical protein
LETDSKRSEIVYLQLVHADANAMLWIVDLVALLNKH